MHNLFSIFLVFIISLLVSSLAHQPVLHFAKKHNYYDNPEARKLQRKPVLVMGGLVVFLGAITGSLCYWFKQDCSSIIPVQIAMLIMLTLGAWDDIRKLSPSFRLIIEVVVIIALGCINNYPIDNLHGLWDVYEISPWIAWPLTVFGCVGIINAINLIDGIDGLSSGFCIMAFGFLGLLFFYAYDFVHVALAIACIGALIPFFITNVFGNKSKMFIGDSGTLMLGIVLCDMVMSILTSDSACAQKAEPTKFCLIAFVLAVLVIPVFDTVRVMFGRISRGESPFHADKTHLHHAFIEYGFHHLETSLMEIILNMMVVGFWWFLYKSHLTEQWQLYGVIAAGVAISFGLYWVLGRRKRIAEKIKEEYGITIEEYEQMTEEEQKQLKNKNKN